MKLKTLTLTMLATIAIMSAQAQDAVKEADIVAAKEARISAYSANLAKELGLDAQQTERMAKADEKYAIAISAMRSMTNDREVLIQKSQELHAEHEAELLTILGEEKFRQLQEWRKAKSQEGMKKLEPVAPPATH